MPKKSQISRVNLKIKLNSNLNSLKNKKEKANDKNVL